ncbi:fasciclin domain-containing protein [Galbibacter mesophilus]|uniref:fasciclin domain-containing protein n=2 Tax=Galbibacter mesophilus TaxID=379069 RepID=UPI00204449EF|nr:fasciclin domain-containing protein [Galbibacter mesophilus]MCM5661383.1 fasciclin domain-containing protein [Galbibacter mesophilus]
MLKQNLSLKAFMLLFIFACSLTACSDSSDEGGEKEDPIVSTDVSLYTYLKEDPKYSLLVEAIIQVGYQDALNVDGGGSTTFFAPTDEAFKAYLKEEGMNSVKNIPTNRLTEIVKNHMLNGKEKFAEEISAGYHKTQAKQFPSQASINLFVSKENDAFVINDGILVTKADIDVNNGVIHEVNKVIKPATLATFLKVDPVFAQLYDASKQINNEVYEKLSNETAKLTVFIPNGKAFSEMPSLTFEKIDQTLRYHIVDGEVITSTKIKNNAMVKTWQGENLTTMTGNDITITDKTGASAKVVAKDFVAWNGVAHVVDKVLLYE